MTKLKLIAREPTREMVHAARHDNLSMLEERK
jgi:hypothetical protein